MLYASIYPGVEMLGGKLEILRYNIDALKISKLRIDFVKLKFKKAIEK